MKMCNSKTMIANKQENTIRKNVQAFIEIGHKAWVRSPDSQSPGKTHDWVLFVCGKDNQECKYVDKVEFRLHETFENPIRVVTEPPFEIHESGYGSFIATVVVHFKVKEAPDLHVTWYYYDLTLPAAGESPIGLSRCEKVTFKSVSMEFVELVLNGGGVVISDEVAEEALEARHAEQEYYASQMYSNSTDMNGSVVVSNNNSINKSKKSKRQNKSNNNTPSNELSENEKRQLEMSLFGEEPEIKKAKIEDLKKPVKQSSESKKNSTKKKTNDLKSLNPSSSPVKKQSPANNKAQHEKNKDNVSSKIGNFSQKPNNSGKTSNVKKSEETKKDSKNKNDSLLNRTPTQAPSSFQGSKSQGKLKENNISDPFLVGSKLKSPQQQQLLNVKNTSDNKVNKKKQISSKPVASKPSVHVESLKSQNEDLPPQNKQQTPTKLKLKISVESNKAPTINNHQQQQQQISVKNKQSYHSPSSEDSYSSGGLLNGNNNDNNNNNNIHMQGFTVSGLTRDELLNIQKKITSLKDDENEGLIYLNIYRILKRTKSFLSNNNTATTNNNSNNTNGCNKFDLTLVDLPTINEIKQCLTY